MITKKRKVVVFSSATSYMAPSPLDPNIIALLKKSGLGIPGSDLERETQYRTALAPYVKKAKDLFKGSFQHMVNAVQDINGKNLQIDLFVISPRYGIISLDEKVVPYRHSFARYSRADINQASARLGTTEKIRLILAGGYDICFIVANKNDLLLIHNPSEGKDISSMCPSLVVLTAASNSNLFSEKAKFYGISNIGKRSQKFFRLLDELVTKPLSHFN
jgi:hypothetical protein